MIPARRAKVANAFDGIHLRQPLERRRLYLWRKFPRPRAAKDFFRLNIGETPYHAPETAPPSTRPATFFHS
jgi:hypothetical protein